MRSVLCIAVGGAFAGTVWAQSPVALPGSSAAVSATPIPASIQAAGYQPDWTLDISAGTLTLGTNLQLQAPPPPVVARVGATQREPSPAGEALRYAASAAKGELSARFVPSACTDPIQGSLHPYTVEVFYAGSRYAGCGGDPAALLQNRMWVVEDIAARGVIDRTRITLHFSGTGEISGRASCNLLEGRYQTTGNALRLTAASKPAPERPAPAKDVGTNTEPAAPTVQGVVPTRKICPPALRRQDAAFFEVLNAVTRWDFTADGALALGTTDGRRIVARRE